MPLAGSLLIWKELRKLLNNIKNTFWFASIFSEIQLRLSMAFLKNFRRALETGTQEYSIVFQLRGGENKTFYKGNVDFDTQTPFQKFESPPRICRSLYLGKPISLYWKMRTLGSVLILSCYNLLIWKRLLYFLANTINSEHARVCRQMVTQTFRGFQVLSSTMVWHQP